MIEEYLKCMIDRFEAFEDANTEPSHSFYLFKNLTSGNFVCLEVYKDFANNEISNWKEFCTVDWIIASYLDKLIMTSVVEFEVARRENWQFFKDHKQVLYYAGKK